MNEAMTRRHWPSAWPNAARIVSSRSKRIAFGSLLTASWQHHGGASFETRPWGAPQDEGRPLMSLRKIPHPEEVAKRPSRRTHGAYPAQRSIPSQALRRLRHGFPELAVMPEKDAGAGRLETGQPVERREHRITVVDALRQPPFAQRSTEVAGIGGEDDIARAEPHLQGLVPRRMAVGRQADDAPVAEQVVLAVDPDHLVAEVEIGSVEPVPCGDVGVHPSFPLALLNDHHGVGDQRVAADMVEMEMRVDDDIDLRRIAVDRLQPGADFLARPIVEREQIRRARSDPPGRVVLAVRMHAGIEQHGPLGVLYQISRDREICPALPALHQIAEISRQVAAGQGKELDTHVSLAFASENNRMFFSISYGRSNSVSGSHSLRATA